MTPCQKLLKQEGTARWIESMQQSSATPKNRDVGRGLRKIVACSQSTSQCLLVSTVFSTVSSLHNDFYTCFTHFSQQRIGIGNDTVGKQRRSYTQRPPRLYRGFVRSAAVRPPAPPAACTLIYWACAFEWGRVGNRKL